MIMSVEDFIKVLQKYPNQKADLNFIVNINNSDDDTYDIENCEVACFQQDVEDALSYDVMIYLDSETESKRTERRDESIRSLLSEHRKLTIELDADAWHNNKIIILDEEENVLREIEVGGRNYQEDNIAIILQSILV